MAYSMLRHQLKCSVLSCCSLTSSAACPCTMLSPCPNLSSQFLLVMQFTEAVVNLKFDEDPKYNPYAQLFEALCGPGPQRPILMEASAKVGQKRPRDSTDEEAQDIVSTHLLAIHCTLQFGQLILCVSTLSSLTF